MLRWMFKTQDLTVSDVVIWLRIGSCDSFI